MVEFPTAIERMLEEYDFEDLFVDLTGLDRTTERTVLLMELRTGLYAPREERQSWEITIENVLHSRIELSTAGSLWLLDDHPLLWEYTHGRAELYINGKARDPKALFLKLYELHDEIFEGRCSFEMYLNQSTSLVKILSAGFGQIANGPAPLLERMAAILEDAGIRTNIFAFHHTPTPADAKPILLMFDDSYIIGTGISFREL